MEINKKSKTVLCVDLDDTLVRTDTLFEITIKLIKNHPLLALKIPIWLTHGLAYTKHKIAKKARISAELLPYNKDVVRFIRKERKKGHPLCLATASDTLTATRITKHLNIFDNIIASDGITNRAGDKKAEAIIKTYGEKQFDYIGNSKADLAVWKHARRALVANAHPSVIKKAKNSANVTQVFPRKKRRKIKTFLKQIRIHQWSKNLLLLVPILTAHKIDNLTPFFNVTLAFIAFSLVASGIYILNDLMDLEADRKHPLKKHRPIASGHMHILVAGYSMIALIITGITISIFLPAPFLIIIALYIIINITYSLHLKQIPLVDIFVLASLYVIRILAGSAATGIATSSWLFIFATFIFISLALAKRVSELNGLGIRKKNKVSGRGYITKDKKTLTILGITSGYISLIIFVLYITSNTVTSLYARPNTLWLLLPLFFFWITRIWRLTHKRKMNEDPIIFAIKDMSSYIVATLAFVILVIAT